MILVTGATGTVGSEVVKLLVGAGQEVRAFVHHPQNAVDVAGVYICQGDYGKPETLQAPMRGVDHLFLLSPSGAEQVLWERNVVDAARDGRIRHIVKLSVYGASPFSPIAINRWHWESEKYIEESGLQYTFVRPNLFMQNMLGQALIIAREGRFYGSAGDGKIAMIDARDIAGVAVKALTEEGHAGASYEITGPEGVSYPEAAEIISRVTGRHVEYMDVPPDMLKQGMMSLGMLEWLANDVLEYQHYFREGLGNRTTNWIPKLLGREASSFEQFVRDYAGMFTHPQQQAA